MNLGGVTRRWVLAAAGAGLASGTRADTSASWPTRPVRVVVSFPAGSATDAMMRILGPASPRLSGNLSWWTTAVALLA